MTPLQLTDAKVSWEIHKKYYIEEISIGAAHYITMSGTNNEEILRTPILEVYAI